MRVAPALISPWTKLLVSTFVLVESTARNLTDNFIGMELDETYFNIAKDRIENHKVAE